MHCFVLSKHYDRFGKVRNYYIACGYDYLFYTLLVLLYYGKSPSHGRLETLMSWADEIQQRYNEKLQPETE